MEEKEKFKDSPIMCAVKCLQHASKVLSNKDQYQMSILLAELAKDILKDLSIYEREYVRFKINEATNV